MFNGDHFMVDENQELNSPEMGDNVPELSEGESQDVNPNINTNMEKGTNGNESSPNSEDSSQNESTNRGAIEYRMRQQMRKIDRRLEQFEAKIADAFAKGFNQSSPEASQMPSYEDNTTKNTQSSGQAYTQADIQQAVEKQLQEKELAKQQQDTIAKIQRSRQKHDDFDEVIEDVRNRHALTDLMISSIEDLPDAPELLYSIAKSNPQEFERISRLSPMQQMREMALVVAKHQSSEVPHGTKEEDQPQVKPNPHKPLPPVSNRGGSMSHGTNNYGFDDRLSELAAGYRKSRP
jgi:hypothetical protein